MKYWIEFVEPASPEDIAEEKADAKEFGYDYEGVPDHCWGREVEGEDALLADIARAPTGARISVVKADADGVFDFSKFNLEGDE